ncbi:MAG: DinB family protein [Chitinophagaceae bacterium]|nr:DinB family protein [Chitinophagaceae bacterium]
MRPLPTDYSPYSETYVSLVRSNDIRSALPESYTHLKYFLDSIPESKAGYVYAPGKWTVKVVLQHAIDTEKVFAYRAMCFARGEQQPLPGFDQDEYAANADVSARTLEGLKEELLLTRKLSILFFENLRNEDWNKKGIASNHPVTVLACAYIIVGHWLHHEKIFKEKYQL